MQVSCKDCIVLGNVWHLRVSLSRRPYSCFPFCFVCLAFIKRLLRWMSTSHSPRNQHHRQTIKLCFVCCCSLQKNERAQDTATMTVASKQHRVKTKLEAEKDEHRHNMKKLVSRDVKRRRGKKLNKNQVSRGK